MDEDAEIRVANACRQSNLRKKKARAVGPGRWSHTPDDHRFLICSVPCDEDEPGIETLGTPVTGIPTAAGRTWKVAALLITRVPAGCCAELPELFVIVLMSRGPE